MKLETEIKVRIAPREAAALPDRLIASGARRVSLPLPEVNRLLDFDDESLRAAGSALRLRSYGSRHLLTFKGRLRNDPELKIREEAETEVDDIEQLKLILQALGLQVRFRYTKVREIFEWTVGGEEVEICLDQTPFGFFVEVEGTPEGIRSVAAQLGWPPSRFITESYVELFSKRSLK